MVSKTQRQIEQEAQDSIVPLARKVIAAYQRFGESYMAAVRHNLDARSSDGFTYDDALSEAYKVAQHSGPLEEKIYQAIAERKGVYVILNLKPLETSANFYKEGRCYELDLNRPFSLKITYNAPAPVWKLFSGPEIIKLDLPLTVPEAA